MVISLLPFVKNTDADCLGSKNKAILSSKAFLRSCCFSDNAMLREQPGFFPIAKQQTAL